MAKIVVKKRAEVIREYFIRPFKSIVTVGSDPDNDLVTDDKKVSRHQFRIEKKGTEYFLTDLESAFGTIVRGRKVKGKVRLFGGDEIKIGDLTLLFFDQTETSNDQINAVHDDLVEIVSQEINEDEQSEFPSEDLSDLESQLAEELKELNPEEQAVKDEVQELEDSPNGFDQAQTIEDKVVVEEQLSETVFEETELESAPTLTVAEETELESAPTFMSSVPQGNYILLGIYGPYTGKKYQLNETETKIGRDTKLNDIVIRKNVKGEVDPSISRRHATVSLKDGRYFITDRRSKTRTFVNQIKLLETDEVQLTPGDEIEIVSDQKSTILRFVPEGENDFARPRKTGVWWVRYFTSIVRLLSITVIALCVISMLAALNKRSILVQKPDPLTIEETVWIPVANNSQNFYMQDAGGYNVASTPALGDVNGDQILDLVYIDSEGYLRLFNGATKKSLLEERAPIPADREFPPVLVDLNGNKMDDIVLVTQKSQLLALDGFNSGEIWTSQFISGPYSGAPVVADFNGDGFQDVGILNQTGKVYIGYAGLAEPDWVSFDIGHVTKGTPSASDFDGDGQSEIIIGTEDGWVVILDALHGVITKEIDINEELNKAKGTYYEDNQIRTFLAIADLNKDQKMDFVVNTRQGNVLAIDGYNFKRLMFAELLGDEPIPPAIHFAPSVGDLNADRSADIVVCTPNGIVKAFRGTGLQGSDRSELLWKSESDAWESLMAPPTLADVNKDGAQDVIICGAWSGVTVYNGRDGTQLWQSPKSDEIIISAPLVADLEGDGFLDIVYLRSDNNFYKAATNCNVIKNTAIWTQLGGSPVHTGIVTYKMPSALGPTLSVVIMALIIGLVCYLNLKMVLTRKKLAKVVA